MYVHVVTETHCEIKIYFYLKTSVLMYFNFLRRTRLRGKKESLQISLNYKKYVGLEIRYLISVMKPLCVLQTKLKVSVYSCSWYTTL